MIAIFQSDGRRRGFTLIEVVAGLVVLAIVVGIGTLFIENVVKAYGIARSYTQIAQKTQAALMRLAGDFNRIRSIDSSSGSAAITYTADFSTESTSVTESHTVRFDAAALLYDDDALIDRVSSFALAYYAADGHTAVGPSAARLVEVTLDVAGAGDATCRFSTRIAIP